MRYTNLFLFLLLLTSWCFSDQRWVRKESTYEIQKVKIEEPQDGASLNKLVDPVLQLTSDKPEYRGETINEIVKKIAPESMTESERWFFTEEFKFLNKNIFIVSDNDTPLEPGKTLKIAQYQIFHGGTCCSDMRNIMVAVMKGKKYGVHWAYLIGVRSQENPSHSRDHYAYGVVCKKGTDLWTQAEWGAKILKRCTRNADSPSFSDIDRASHTYVGYESSEWVRNVWAVYNRCQD